MLEKFGKVIINKSKDLDPENIGMTPETSILMSDGSVKNIENVELGDCVITHTGTIKKVIKKNTVNHNGLLNIFKIGNGLPLTTTHSNTFLKVNLTSKDVNVSRSLLSGKYNYKISLPEELKEKDILCSPVINNRIDSEINENKARLLGLWAAEGSIHGNEIIFSFGKDEEHTLAKLASELIKKEWGIISKIKVAYSKAEVNFTNKDVRIFFENHVGKGSFTKKLSKEIVFGSNDIKISFLTGWLEGDGGIDKYSGKIIGATISPHLASQTVTMLNSLRINNTLKKSNPKTSTLKSGRKIIGKHQVFEVVIPYNECNIFINKSNEFNNFQEKVKFVKILRFIDNYRMYKILDKKLISYNGLVYSLEVEDENSYVANNIIIYNLENIC